MAWIKDAIIDISFGIYNLTAPRLPKTISLPSDPFKAMNSFFDAVWVLTIHRNADRQDFMRRQLARLYFEFFNGVDGKSLQEGDSRLDLGKAARINGRPVGTNELACTMSHLVMFQAIVDRHLERVLIFEDDAIFLPKRGKWISYCLERIPPDWELLYLGYRDAELRGFEREIQELFGRPRKSSEVVSRAVGRGIRTAGGHDFTHAYAVTRNGAQKLLADSYPVCHTADGWLEHKVLAGDMKAFICVPKLFVQQEKLGSSIHRT